MTRHSPILRIAVVAALLAADACDKLGLGDGKSPTAPSGPAPGSTIVYNAIGASDVNGVGSSVVCLPLDSGRAGMGYVYVAARQLRAQGFTVSLRPLGLPTPVIGRDFETLGQQASTRTTRDTPSSPATWCARSRPAPFPRRRAVVPG